MTNKKLFLSTYIIIILLLLLVSCKSKKNELQLANIKGNVSSVREITYQIASSNGDTLIKGNIITGEDYKNYYCKYNEDGNITEITDYDNNNEKLSFWIFFYNRKKCLGGNYYFADETLMDSTSYIYDSKGRIKEYYHYYGDKKLKNRIVSSYDRHGNITEEKFYSADNMLLNTTKCKYKKGNLISDSSFDNSNKLLYYSKYLYDKNNNLIKHTIYTSNGDIKVKGEYKYNCFGDMIQCKQGKYVYKYEYKYDNENNWIEKISFFNNEAYLITIRQIEYF